ncbi:hypothetical protein VQH59_004829, partial [Salmonella enterica]|nr:hypothetical protein [Salmonella enterica]
MKRILLIPCIAFMPFSAVYAVEEYCRHSYRGLVNVNVCTSQDLQHESISINNRTDALMAQEKAARAEGEKQTLATARAHADKGDTDTLATARQESAAREAAVNSRTDALVEQVRAAQDNGDKQTLAAARAHADKGDADALAAARAHADKGDTDTLA